MSPSAMKSAIWFANFCFLSATISLLSPQVAATSLFPWIAYFLGNGVWALDSYQRNNWGWVWMGVFFSVWDLLIIFSRLYGFEVFSILQPLVTLLEKLP